jgi:hypothetical protein
LHKQQFELSVKRKKARIVPLKGKDSACGSPDQLSLPCETRWAALKHTEFSNCWNLFKTIDFSLCGGLSVDDYKGAAFQLGQFLGLIEGKELYTKSEVQPASLDN